MQAFFKRTGVIAAFVVLLIVLISNAMSTLRRVDQQLGNQAWVTHTRQVLFELSQTESFLKDAETSQRGYLYTKDENYLGPYREAGPQIDSSIQRLANLTADNPDQQNRISLLRRLTHEKLDELALTIQLQQAGKTAQA